MVDWHLLPGERRIHETKMSRIVFWNYYFLALTLLAISAALNTMDLSRYYINVPKLEASGILIAASLVIIFLAEKFEKREMVLLTTERVLIRKRGLSDSELENNDVKSGIYGAIGAVRMEALKLETITNVQVRQTLRQRIAGMGDIAILSGMEEHIVRDLHHPFDVERGIYRIIEKRKDASEKKQ